LKKETKKSTETFKKFPYLQTNRERLPAWRRARLRRGRKQRPLCRAGAIKACHTKHRPQPHSTLW